jgi:eukaryotic translation initiation factor 2C
MPDHTNHQDFYSFLKNKINCDSPVISQFVANRTIQRDNDRIFLNIIRQMNAKFGGDLWRMQFGEEISDQTMLVGIDVCHKGKQSTIGFCATYDPYMCKYYAQASPQPVKGQEIISTSVLSDYFQRAFASYKEFNGKMPKHIFIYRDGVGDSMRQLVIEQELKQLHNIISVEYGLTEAEDFSAPKLEPPEITLIIVNKRVR